MNNLENAIYNAIGHKNRLISMIGAKDFVCTDDSLIFKFKKSNNINMLTIKLNALDTYDIIFANFNLSKAVYKVISEECDIQAENLKNVIESKIKLKLSIG